MSKPRLSLYHYRSCPFCDVVRRTSERLRLDIELRDIHRDPRHLRELVVATGRTTVPCLRIARPDAPDEWMHESANIVEYLEQLAGGARLNAGA